MCIYHDLWSIRPYSYIFLSFRLASFFILPFSPSLPSVGSVKWSVFPHFPKSVRALGFVSLLLSNVFLFSTYTLKYNFFPTKLGNSSYKGTLLTLPMWWSSHFLFCHHCWESFTFLIYKLFLQPTVDSIYWLFTNSSTQYFFLDSKDYLLGSLFL